MAKCINTYNGSENNGSTLVTLINFFIEKGLTETQAACIIGSIEKDTNLKSDTEIKENNTTYIGLCKWEGDRATALNEFAKKQNKEWKNINLQLDYLWSELNGKYKKNVLDWFSEHKKSAVNECMKQWTKEFMGLNKCKDEKDRIGNAKKVLEFYKKYANGECTKEPEQTNENNGSSAGSDIDGTGLIKDESKPSVICGISISGTVQTQTQTQNNENEEATQQTENNTTDYNGKTLVLRLERSEFNCERTFGELYDTTDGKKQFICYVIEDAVRYKGNQCVKKLFIGNSKNLGPTQKVAIPYGTYSFSMGKSGFAYNCPNHKECRYYYAANYKKYPKYNGKIARLQKINVTGCEFDAVLIHASPDNSRGDENNTAGCLVVGTKKHEDFLSGTIDAFYRLYENFILPAAESGSKLKIEIPRLYPDKDTKCCPKC